MEVWKTELSHGAGNIDPIAYEKLFSVNDIEEAFRNLQGERGCRKGGKKVIDVLKLICINLESKSLSLAEIQQAFRGVRNKTYWVQQGLVNLQSRVKI